MAAPQTKKRKFLSLEQKAQIIAEAATGRKNGSIGEEYGISPSSLSTILKSEASISKALASGMSAQRKKTTQPAHEDFDKVVYYLVLRDKGAKKIPISGTMIQQKALNYACLLGVGDDFKASTGWLNRFKERHDIVGEVLSGESASADSNSASSWIATNTANILEKCPRLMCTMWTRPAILQNDASKEACQSNMLRIAVCR
ncbi:hypothetical protein HPB48_002046 [Haemaphysalis longicornis]|uniref:HTH CENPB-type domain-containing protein n=1 Tax=Haemaphysalis longicornis TaxID=44386 RepID=A0A9J6FJI4_HAELO|nr:hypothetical protein HPB48_002046 [Haemaphysalis longicornis]